MKSLMKKMWLVCMSVLLSNALLLPATKPCNYFLVPGAPFMGRSAGASEQQSLAMQQNPLAAQDFDRCVSMPLDISETDIGLLKKGESGCMPYACFYGAFKDGHSVVICRSANCQVGSNATAVFECVKRCSVEHAKGQKNKCLRIGKTSDGSWCFLRKK